MPSATRGAASVEIAASPERVYDLISDVAKIGDRSPECYRSEWLDGVTVAAVGARFRGHNRLGFLKWKTVCEVTAAEPGREFGFCVVDGRGRKQTNWRYVIEDIDGGVRLSESYEFLWCPLIMRIAETPIPRDRQLRDGLRETIEHIKAEAQST
jgi:hypothetical protein